MGQTPLGTRLLSQPVPMPRTLQPCSCLVCLAFPSPLVAAGDRALLEILAGVRKRWVCAALACLQEELRAGGQHNAALRRHPQSCGLGAGAARGEPGTAGSAQLGRAAPCVLVLPLGAALGRPDPGPSPAVTAPSLPAQVHVSLGNVTGVQGGGRWRQPRAPAKHPRLASVTQHYHFIIL